MLRRRQINSEPRDRGGRALAAVGDVVRWPFERLAWLLESRVLWPLSERSAGWRPPRSGAAGALVAIAASAVLAAVLLLPGSGSAPDRVAQPATVAIAPAPEPAPGPASEPAPAHAATELQGAAPDFSVGPGRGVTGAEGSGSPAGAGADSGDAEAETGSAASPGAEEAEGGATTSARKPVPPGPAAMRVARRFSEAFVFYEIGKRRDRAEEVFGKTASPRLARALAERPPRQPSRTEVPRARVVNLVPGPRSGRAYTVSASLLRVGLITELRLELRRDDEKRWRVTDVRG